MAHRGEFQTSRCLDTQYHNTCWQSPITSVHLRPENDHEFLFSDGYNVFEKSLLLEEKIYREKKKTESYA